MIRRTAVPSVRSRILARLPVVAVLAALLATGSVTANEPAALPGSASAPTVLNYQGIVEVNGRPYEGPTGYFKFAIVDAARGDGTTNYWANDGRPGGEPGDAVSLRVSSGLFNVLLGDTTLTGMSEPVRGNVFATEPVYLRVWFSPKGTMGSFEALDPNQRIASVAYALRAAYAEDVPANLDADTVDGYHASEDPTPNHLVPLDASGYLRVPRMLDFDNAGYYVDPDATSELNNVVGRRFGVTSVMAGAGYHVTDSTAWDVDYGLYVGSVDMSGVKVEDANASGVSGTGQTQGGYFVDSTSGVYARVSHQTWGLYTDGEIYGASVSTVALHPTDSTKTIQYGVLEGGEAGTYYRGTAALNGGTAIVSLPEHFRLRTAVEGLTVQVTPREDCNGLFVAEVSTAQIVVKELAGGSSNARFDFLINGVRAEYQDFKVYGSAADLLPNEDGGPDQGATDD
jgi:hypothetical protein